MPRPNNDKLIQITEQIRKTRLHYKQLVDLSSDYDQHYRSLKSNASLYDAVKVILEQIEIIETSGAGTNILWDKNEGPEPHKRRKLRLNNALDNYRTRITQLKDNISATNKQINDLQNRINSLELLRLDLQHEYDKKRSQYVVYRSLPSRQPDTTTLPWSNPRNDKIRLYSVVTMSLAIALASGLYVQTRELIDETTIKPIEIPERIVRLVINKPRPVPTVSPEPEAANEETSPDDASDADESTEARNVAESSGILAFRQDFSEIMTASADIDLGSAARVESESIRVYSPNTQRNLLTTQSSLSKTNTGHRTRAQRKLVDTSNELDNIAFTRVDEIAKELDINTAAVNQDTSKPARSDEQIQLIFDRYKDTLYRLYNRELRVNPMLRGKIILRLTIEANGKVSGCSIESSDLSAPSLETKIIERVLKFNFGSVPGADRLTLLYPIEFLPAS